MIQELMVYTQISILIRAKRLLVISLSSIYNTLIMKNTAGVVNAEMRLAKFQLTVNASSICIKVVQQ
jgi:hypothetical protein